MANPPHDTVLAADGQVLVIARNWPDLHGLKAD